MVDPIRHGFTSFLAMTPGPPLSVAALRARSVRFRGQPELPSPGDGGVRSSERTLMRCSSSGFTLHGFFNIATG
jgi:hypothetical protein